MLFIPILLIGIGVFTPRAGKIQVRGPLSAQDVKAIRHELRRAQWKNARREIERRNLRGLHLDPVLLRQPLKLIESMDGKTAAEVDPILWTGKRRN